MTTHPKVWPKELSCELRDDLHSWCALWNVSTLVPEISVTISRRMTSSLGRASYTRQSIGLQHTLLDPTAKELLREVLCHEAAHLAAYRLHGKTIRPHGSQWKSLLSAAGYPPRATIAAATLPACFGVRRARRVVKRRKVRRSPWKVITRWIRG